MDRPFSDDDREKRIVTSDGQSVGNVRNVENDRVTVERSDDDSLTDEIMEFLGWSDDDDAHEIRHDQVDRHEDDELYLHPRW